MEQGNNKQDRVIFEIEDLLNKMSRQVNFLIRKDLMLSQLDVDLLMENTRKLYDTICSVELGIEDEKLGVGNEELGIDFEDVDENPEMNSDSGIPVAEPTEVTFEFEIPEDEKLGVGNEELGIEDEDLGIDFEDVDETAEMDSDSEILVAESAEVTFEFEIAEDEKLGVGNEELGIEDEELGIDFDDVDETTETASDSEIPVAETSETEAAPAETERFDVETVGEVELIDKDADSGIRAYRRIGGEYHTVSDMLEQIEDNSLAARLQRKPVQDLMSAIGINDRFLFLNELFGGSMEKYNKSIRALNNFSTLLGAKTYMSELQIEFQWDCNSDTYKKLADLVERRFLSIHNA